VWQINNSRLTSWSCYSCRLIKSKNRSLNHLFSYNCEDVFKYRLDQTDQLETGIFTTLLLFSILQECCIATFAFTESVTNATILCLEFFFSPSKAIVSSELMLCGWQLQRSTLMACSSFTLQGPTSTQASLAVAAPEKILGGGAIFLIMINPPKTTELQTAVYV